MILFTDINFLFFPALKDSYPNVIFLKPNIEKKFSKGKNSPKGTSLFLSYLDIKFNLLSITAKEL